MNFILVIWRSHLDLSGFTSLKSFRRQNTCMASRDQFRASTISSVTVGATTAVVKSLPCGYIVPVVKRREREREREKRCCLFMRKTNSIHYLCRITYIAFLYFLNKDTWKVPLPLLLGNLNAAMLISTALAVTCTSLCRARVLPVVALPDLDFEFFPWALILGYTTFFLILATWQNVLARFRTTHYFLDKHLGRFSDFCFCSTFVDKPNIIHVYYI